MDCDCSAWHYALVPGSAIFLPIKGQGRNILDLVGHKASVATTQLVLQTGNNHKQYGNQCMWLSSNKIFLHKQVEG